MTNPTLEQYIEGVEKEFDKKYLKTYPDGEIRFIRGLFIEDIHEFLKSSIQGAWEKGREELIDEIIQKLRQYSHNQGGDVLYQEAVELILSIKAIELSQLRRNND